MKAPPTKKLAELLEKDQLADLQSFVEASGPDPRMFGCWCRRTRTLIGAVAKDGGLLHLEAAECPDEQTARRELERIGGELPRRAIH